MSSTWIQYKKPTLRASRDRSLSPDERNRARRRFYVDRRAYFAHDDVRRLGEFGKPRECKAREAAFVAAFIGRLEAALACGVRVGKKELAKAAVEEAYRDRRPRAVARKAEELLEMPRVQRAIADTLKEKGVDVARAGEVIAEVMSTGEPGDKLRAVELFFKVTTGFAVTKTANLHKHEKDDKFFDPQRFDRPGAPKRVTPPETIDQE